MKNIIKKHMQLMVLYYMAMIQKAISFMGLDIDKTMGNMAIY